MSRGRDEPGKAAAGERPAARASVDADPDQPDGATAQAREQDPEQAEAPDEDQAEDQAPESPTPRPARGSASRRGRRRRGAGPRTKVAAALLAVLALVGLGGWLWSVPTLRSQVLDSFTERGSSFTELYFTTDPTIQGATVVVPITVTDHGTGARSYQLKVTLESPNGSASATDTVSLVPKDGTPVPVVVRLQTNDAAAMVRVDLLGHPQTLHFHFGKQPTANP
ncbi:hypothetical protein ABH930_000836 [Kitasatospora sp. GAS204A]|uniref:hypothetical protein n=1 Tax=unclassified Kitasatospora TaxID=2633591 RepID=UPI002476421C|nr:hypothetical protein [Kitasatospora sp. GAS204B]MDH6116437.1 hypothetical protein [Kitasatospora sp. GAS204B]